MYEAVQNGDGYVIGQRIRGGSQDLIDWVLEDDLESSYQKTYDSNGVLTYKVKSEVGYYDVKITSPLNGQKSLVKLSQKRVVFWSKDYSDKAKYERQKIIDKAKDIITNPKKYLKSTVGDAATLQVNTKLKLNSSYGKLAERIERVVGHYELNEETGAIHFVHDETKIEAILKHDYAAHGIYFDANEIFISDGSKSDTGNIGDILRHDNSIGVTDPIYPAYIDSNVSCGRAGTLEKDGKWSNVVYMPCRIENNFIPETPETEPIIGIISIHHIIDFL